MERAMQGTPSDYIHADDEMTFTTLPAPQNTLEDRELIALAEAVADRLERRALSGRPIYDEHIKRLRGALDGVT
jgi:hypothetical protein